MRVKCLVRNPDDHMRETKRDLFKVKRNFDPALHPFETQREYVRALNAVKLEKMFAKPFVGNLDGHRDGVSCISKHPGRLSLLATGAYDGEIRLWDLPTQACSRVIQAHEGAVRGLAFTPLGETFITVGDDKTIKIWHTDLPDLTEDIPVDTIISKEVVTGVSHARDGALYATCGELCQLWEEGRNEPLKSLQWGADSLHHVAFNPVETHLLSTCCSDRSVILYDTREENPVRKVTLTLRANQLSWNPMEATRFVVASDDNNLYSFDVRKLSETVNTHKGFTGAVTCVDFSPTGLEFVAGSYDRTIRIFQVEKRASREIYHTKRMQRLSGVVWSLDDKYILSASDEMNIRLWKARASEKIGVMTPRERKAREYNAALKRKFEAFPKVRSIANHRNIPKHVLFASKQNREMVQAQNRREVNRRLHSKPGTVPHVEEKVKAIVKEQE